MTSTITSLSKPFAAAFSAATKSAQSSTNTAKSLANNLPRVLSSNLNAANLSSSTLFSNATSLVGSNSNKFTHICQVFNSSSTGNSSIENNAHNSENSTSAQGNSKNKYVSPTGRKFSTPSRSFSTSVQSSSTSTCSTSSSTPYEEVAAGCGASTRKFYSSAMPSDVFAAIKEKDQIILNLKSEVDALKKWKIEAGFDDDVEEEENAKNSNSSGSTNSSGSSNNANVNMSAAGVGGIFFFTYAAAASHMLFLDSVPGVGRAEDPAVVEQRNESKRKVSQMKKKLTSTGVKRRKDAGFGKKDFGALA